MGDEIQVHTLVTGSFVENGYILHRDGHDEAIVIDPGAESTKWIDELKQKGLRPVVILATHAHLDHVGAAADIQKEHDAEFHLHAQEEQVLDTLDWQCDLFGIPRIPKPRVTKTLQDDETLEAAGIKIHVIATPGHTPGSSSYHVPELKRVFTGDTLFAGTIGRTDLPGGDHDTLVASLEGLCRRLDDETIVLPGHGPATTIQQERTANPYFRVAR